MSRRPSSGGGGSGSGQGRRRSSRNTIGGVEAETTLVLRFLSAMVAVTAVGILVVFVNHHRMMTVPATLPLPGAMERADLPSSLRAVGGTPQYPKGPSTHGSIRGWDDGGGSYGFAQDSAAARQGQRSTTVAKRDRLGRKPPAWQKAAAWRDSEKPRNNLDERPTLPPLVGGGGDKPGTAAGASKEAILANKAALSWTAAPAGGGGGAGAGGTGGGGGNAKKQHTPPKKALSAAKGVSAAANIAAADGEDGVLTMMAGRAGGGGGGDRASKTEKKVPPRKAPKRVTRSADREVMAEEALLAIMSGKGE